MTMAARYSWRPTRADAARPTRSPRIRSMRRATRSCSSTPKGFLRWRRPSSSLAIPVPAASATASSSAQRSPGRGASSSRARVASVPARCRWCTWIRRICPRCRPTCWCTGAMACRRLPCRGPNANSASSSRPPRPMRKRLPSWRAFSPTTSFTTGTPAARPPQATSPTRCPNIVSFKRADGTYGAIVPSGTRDPVFFENYAHIKAAVIKLIQEEFPDALRAASYRIIDADAQHPVALLRTVDADPAQLQQRHQAEIARLTAVATAQPDSLFNLDAADAYEWTLYHLIQNEDVIKNVMFPINYFRANGSNWKADGT